MTKNDPYTGPVPQKNCGYCGERLRGHGVSVGEEYFHPSNGRVHKKCRELLVTPPNRWTDKQRGIIGDY